MENTDVINSVKVCFGSIMFFGFNYDGTQCHHIVLGWRIFRDKSKDYILFIKSCQLYTVSIYGTGITVADLRDKNELILEVIGKISSCELVIYVFVGRMRRDTTIFIPILNRTGGTKISGSTWDLSVISFLIKYHFIESNIRFCWVIFEIKRWRSKSSWWIISIFQARPRHYLS